MEQHEEYLDYVKNEEESVIEKFSYKKLEKDITRLSLALTVLKK